MMKPKLYFNKDYINKDLMFDIIYIDSYKTKQKFKLHWHENTHLYYFTSGSATVECSSKTYNVCANDIVIINPFELHSLTSTSDSLKFYIIRFDISFLLKDKLDIIQIKYLTPLSKNLITFKNVISKDNEILSCVKNIINEYNQQLVAYELSLKSYIYNLLVLLIRNYINRYLTDDEYRKLQLTANKFSIIFKYIDDNYSKKIYTDELANLIHVSTPHFCRSFKKYTGLTVTDYINNIRLKNAILLLNEDALNITEIALLCGFDNINYFSRLFKKHYNISPTEYRKQKNL